MARYINRFLAFTAIILLAACASERRVILKQSMTMEKNKIKLSSTSPLQMQKEIEANLGSNPRPHVIIGTKYGNIELELFAKECPITVSNFLTLINHDFYRKMYFHRVIPDSIIQGGCKYTKVSTSATDNRIGTGDAGYKIKDEIIPSLSHNQSGLISMANNGKPNTGSSQFFITLRALPNLDGKHTIFGRVVKGFDVLDKISDKKKSRKNSKVYFYIKQKN